VEKLRHYHRSLELLEELEPDAPLVVRRLRNELEQLDVELMRRRYAELAR
jgi:hypothetical protein